MISIIIPVYNAQAFLPRCIESVLSQRVPLECILVDDGSRDDSLAICQQYAAQDGRIRVIHQENAGVSSARNAGLAVSSGEYICFLDSDDYLLPDALEIAQKTQAQYSGRWILWNYDIGDDSPVREGISLFPAKELGQLYIDCLIAMPWNKLYRAEIARSLTFDASLSLGEDLKFCLEYHKAAGCPDFALIRSPLTYYDCSHEGETLSTRYHPDYCDLWLELFGMLRRQCADLGTEQTVLSVLEQMELRMVAEGIGDILERAPLSTKEKKIKARKVLYDHRLHALLERMRREKVYSPYYWSAVLNHLPQLRRMVTWKRSGSPWFGRFDWLGYYLLGGKWQR